MFHKGHERLLEAAFRLGNNVLVGVMADGFKTGHEVEPYKLREEHVIDFLKKRWLFSRATVQKITDPFTPALAPWLEGIVVSEETRPSAETINEMRVEKGLKPLHIEQVQWALAQDKTIISSTAIRDGRMDRNGKIVKKG